MKRVTKEIVPVEPVTMETVTMETDNVNHVNMTTLLCKSSSQCSEAVGGSCPEVEGGVSTRLKKI